MHVEQALFNMIEQQIRPFYVLYPAILSFLSIVHRDAFFPVPLRIYSLMYI